MIINLKKNQKSIRNTGKDTYDYKGHSYYNDFAQTALSPLNYSLDFRI